MKTFLLLIAAVIFSLYVIKIIRVLTNTKSQLKEMNKRLESLNAYKLKKQKIKKSKIPL
jgi:uncharacterized protein YoxC